MEVEYFIKKINLMEEAIANIYTLDISEREYLYYKEIFFKERQRCYKEILRFRDYRIRFLYYYIRFACDIYEVYLEKFKSEKIFFDTFYDITLWTKACFNEFGEYGINQYDWFSRHFDCKIARLGRLEFEVMASIWQSSLYEFEIGDEIINVHIPAGDKLLISDVKESFSKAFDFFGKEYIYICHSWLLYPKLLEVLNKNSNILKFQKLFHLIDIDFDFREGEWRIFDKILDDYKVYPENTSLQIAAKKYLLEGNKLGNGVGIYKK